jgi:hypothetical protein
MLGNLVENAAKYGNGRVFVTVDRPPAANSPSIEDDGRASPSSNARSCSRADGWIPPESQVRASASYRRDVAEIYGSSVSL